MHTVLLLASEAGHHGGGFGLNFDILETNLINLAILIGGLVYFGPGVVGKILGERKSSIAEAIAEAEDRLKTASTALAEQQKKLSEAQAEAVKIIAEAEIRGKEMKERILAQSVQDVENMKASANQELDAERDRVMAELRSIVANKALASTESQLKERLNDQAQQQLIDRSLTLLG